MYRIRELSNSKVLIRIIYIFISKFDRKSTRNQMASRVVLVFCFYEFSAFFGVFTPVQA